MLKSTPDQEPEAHRRGVALEREGKLEQALAAFSELSTQDDYSHLARSLCRGRILWKLQRLEEAVEAYQKAISIKPDSEIGTLGLYHTLMDCGRFDEAVEEGKRFFQGTALQPRENPNIEKYRVDIVAFQGMGDDFLNTCRKQARERAEKLLQARSDT